MNSIQIGEPATRPICLQPGCLLKSDSFNPRDLAGLLVQTLAGESLEHTAPQSELIVARPQCTDCALRVMQGGKAYLTKAEWSHLDDLGDWYNRRKRRRERLGYSG